MDDVPTSNRREVLAEAQVDLRRGAVVGVQPFQIELCMPGGDTAVGDLQGVADFYLGE